MDVEFPEFSWQGRTVLITGCAGFLGCWLARRLCDHGARLIGLDTVRASRESPFGLLGLLDEVRFVSGDLRDYPLFERVVREHPVETVFHLAAQSQVSLAKQCPKDTFDVNILGTWNLLEAVRIAGRPIQVLIASSDAVYGDGTDLPYTEETPLGGHTPYAVSKICGELIGRTFYRTYGLPICAVRCSNLYGSGDLNFRRIIPGAIRAVLRGEAPQILSDGRPARDYLYVEDAVAAYLKLAETMPRPGIAGEAFNISSEKPVSVIEIVRTILRLADRSDLAPQILGQTADDPPVKYSSSRKARERFGWSARVSLESGLKQTLDWYRQESCRGWLNN